MKTTGNTVLITGGGSGIGLETAKLLSARGNRIIIAGRNFSKLQKAAMQMQHVTPIACDITNREDVRYLSNRIRAEHGDLNLLVNNAGTATAYTLSSEAGAYEIAVREMNTNFLSSIRLTEELLPLLNTKQESAIMNISSIVAFAPAAILPTYSASKAALHSYTQTLRLTLERTGSPVKVFEVMPPMVETEFSKELKGVKMDPSLVAEEILAGLEADNYEIHVGTTSMLYKVYLESPQKALRVMNNS